MDIFRPPTSIYQQIADLVCERLLLRVWTEDSRIPSVRDLAVELQVNPNTVMRSYTWLQEQGIIVNQRGVGYFAAPGSREKALQLKRDEFLRDELPRLFRNLELLEISWDDVGKLHQISDSHP